jgi:hypothetical protein
MKDWTPEDLWAGGGGDIVSCGPVRSRHELVLLVFLHEHPRFWTVEELADHMKLSEPQMADALNRLWAFEFLIRSGSITRRTFKLAPSNRELKLYVESLVRRWNQSSDGSRISPVHVIRYDDVLN